MCRGAAGFGNRRGRAGAGPGGRIGAGRDGRPGGAPGNSVFFDEGSGEFDRFFRGLFGDQVTAAGEIMGLRMGEVFAPHVVFFAPEGDILEAPEQEGGFVDELMFFRPEFAQPVGGPDDVSRKGGAGAALER